MSITIELTEQENTEVKQITKLNGDSEAVSKAVREFVRLRRLRELKAVSGSVEFDDHWQELETLELRETQFPQ